MRKIEIESILPGEFIANLGNKLNVSCALQSNEYSIQIPPSWGTGSISAVQFDGGIGFLQYDCTFFDDVEIHFIDENVHPLKFIYCLDGHLQVWSEDKEEFFEMKKYNSTIMSNQGQKGHIFKFAQSESIKIRTIEIQRNLFHKRFDWDDQEYKSKLQDLFKDHEAKDAFSHNGMYSVRLRNLFKKIENFSHDGIARAVFLEGMTLEVLSEQLSLYEDDLNVDGQGTLRDYELTCIGKAAQIIEDELEDISTIPKIAHRVGININKLQEGFKIQYNMTVNQYIHQERMKRAVYLLRESSYNISEVVNKVGLSSKSYFSKIFKDAYGITPLECRKEKLKREENKFH